MKTKAIIPAAFILAICLAVPTGLFAGDINTMSSSSDGIREVLIANIDKRVSVRTDSGESIEGTVTKIGDNLVHLSKLSGKDFYDAMVRIDRISSIVYKARGN